MRVTIISITAAVALVGLTLSGMGRSNTPAPALVKPLVASSSVPQQPSDRSAVGTLDQVDVATQQITVATSTGKLVFHVVQGATIRQDRRRSSPRNSPRTRGSV